MGYFCLCATEMCKNAQTEAETFYVRIRMRGLREWALQGPAQALHCIFRAWGLFAMDVEPRKGLTPYELDFELRSPEDQLAFLASRGA